MATIGSARLTLKPHVLLPAILALCLFILIVNYIFQNGQINSSKPSERKGRNLKRAPTLNEKSIHSAIDPRVLKLPDSRSLYCKQQVYDFNHVPSGPQGGQQEGQQGGQQGGQQEGQQESQQKGRMKSSRCVSIILIFNDYQFYEMKKSLDSILISGGVEMIHEILVIDDASSLDYIIHHASSYLSQIPSVKLMKTNSNEPLGVANARNLAAKAASGRYLVFLDNTVVATQGWLQPLIHWLLYNPLTIATPHFDLIRDPVSMFYSILPDNTTFTTTLTLAIRPYQIFSSPATSDYSKRDLTSDINDPIDYSHTAVYDSPALRGDIFALEKAFFLETLEGYEEILEDFGGGESFDLSLKAWLCGRGIKVLTCSKVGVVNVLDPVKTRSNFNLKFLVKKWFEDSGFTSSIYRLANKGKISDRADDDSDEKRENILRNKLLVRVQKPQHCKVPIRRYISKVAINLVKLRDDSIAYGFLKAGTNRCAHLIRTDTIIKIKMDICGYLIVRDPRGMSNVKDDSDSLVYEKETIFQLSRRGQLRVGSNDCVTAKDNAYLSVDQCVDGSERQKFKYQDGRIVNIWSKYCVMQVTDPDARMGKDRQIAMIQTCDSYSHNDKDFMTWRFINL